MNQEPNIKSHSILSKMIVLIIVIVASLQFATAMAANVNRFVFSDNIGDPKEWKPGEVNVGEFIENVTITAVDANGQLVTTYGGKLYLNQQTDYGIGGIEPETIQMTNGQWTGTVRVFRSGTKKSSVGVVGDVWIRASDGAVNPVFGDSQHFCARPLSASKFLVTAPGEEHLPGSSTGKIGQPQKQVSDADFSITVYTTDDFWNRVKPERALKLFFTSEDAGARLPGYVDMEGTSSIAVTVAVKTSGQTISVQNTLNTEIKPGASSPILFTEAEMDHFTIDDVPGPVVAGQPFTITVTARSTTGGLFDEFNGYVFLSATSGDGTLSPSQFGPLEDGKWSGQVMLTRAQTAVVLRVVNDVTPDYEGESNAFTVLPGELNRVQILLPGQQATPGILPGRIGAANTQFVNVAFPIQVRATDAWWNAVQPNNLELSFSASESGVNLPVAATLNISQASYNVTFTSEGQSRIFVNPTNQTVAGDTSTNFYVDLGLVSHFDFSAISSPQVAGRPFSVQITAMNSHGNAVTNFNGDIILSASTGNGTISTTGVTLTDGTWQGELFVTAADNQVVLYAADYVAPPNNHTGTSAGFLVVPDTLAGLQIVMPGQATTPGVTPGFKNDVTPQVAGVPVDVTVRAVDRFWNLIADRDDSIAVASTDNFLVVSNSVALANGEAQVPATFRTAAEQTLTVRFKSMADLPAAEGEMVVVSPNIFARLLLLLPGESLLPGDNETDLNNTPGRDATPITQTAGIQFTVEVVAVDEYWNLAENVPADEIRLYITDPQAQVLPTTGVLADGATQFSVILTKGGNLVLRAINVSNAGIEQSPDAVPTILVGGLHYVVTATPSTVVAGDSFSVKIEYKNGVEDMVNSSHVIQMSAVSPTLQPVPGTLERTTINLISGERTVKQSFNRTGKIIIKVVDDLGTDPGFSNVIYIIAGEVASLNMAPAKAEVGGEQETEVTLTLTDDAGNPTPAREVNFAMVAGTGTLSQSLVMTDSLGVAHVMFRGGRVTETNTIRATVGSMFTATNVAVNLMSSAAADGEVVNYPNPFGADSPSTRIDYYLSEDANVTLKVFDLFGNLVWTAEFDAGMPGGQGRARSLHPNSIEWDGVNGNGQKVGNGGYILIAKAESSGKVIMNTKRKIVVVR
jgi:hypothetical protein